MGFRQGWLLVFAPRRPEVLRVEVPGKYTSRLTSSLHPLLHRVAHFAHSHLVVRIPHHVVPVARTTVAHELSTHPAVVPPPVPCEVVVAVLALIGRIVGGPLGGEGEELSGRRLGGLAGGVGGVV